MSDLALEILKSARNVVITTATAAGVVLLFSLTFETENFDAALSEISAFVSIDRNYESAKRALEQQIIREKPEYGTPFTKEVQQSLSGLVHKLGQDLGLASNAPVFLL
ncbi:MAG: hypothetical protein N838_18830 [Thiohalocapsa sp. PB-PSB1]|jgi:hypothetical protein|nr:MAG: hypothetical protein N838_33795 [Thiohalocapsa sp. PB-PSB1]QQO55090.1 MAG: hypothetical protein N838_18830 [Thiohalocapsa sp. PB-PSB1]